uniref:Secreted protein n=1 Tax=Hydatigena taeniaeformis TaxID=6205 RepID=A0A0R3WP09_HYDTA
LVLEIPLFLHQIPLAGLQVQRQRQLRRHLVALPPLQLPLLSLQLLGLLLLPQAYASPLPKQRRLCKKWLHQWPTLAPEQGLKNQRLREAV